jgi:hypothetical protein
VELLALEGPAVAQAYHLLHLRVQRRLELEAGDSKGFPSTDWFSPLSL